MNQIRNELQIKNPVTRAGFFYWQSTHDIFGTFEDDDFEIIASAYIELKRYL